MAIEMIQISDEVLTVAAKIKGPSSIEAEMLGQLRLLRAKDRQVFAFLVGGFLIVGPVPDARTERALIESADDEDDEDHEC